MADVISGLSCPNCAGTLAVREGQRLVKCPYCSACSLVRGERGVGRYQVARKVSREAALQAVRGFWSGWNKAFDLGAQAQVTDLFLVYLPYWRGLADVVGWVFGRKEVGTNKNRRKEPREILIGLPATEWTNAAGDVAEFGVTSLNLQGASFAAYNADSLHAEGMVFEPTGSQTEALESARDYWVRRGAQKADLDDVTQTWLRFLRESLSLVYYPLWVARYAYRQRVYQVVVDGYRGQVLYGKAPGNIYYRALMLVAGTSIGSFLIINGTALAFWVAANSSGSSDEDWVAFLFLPTVAGAALVYGGYRLFRWGEEIEHKVKGNV